LPFVTVAGGAGGDGTPGTGSVDGLRIDGQGVVLSALRRCGDELEVRLVAETAAATTAVLSGRRILAARDVDLLGRDGPARPPNADGTLRVALGPWEIRTLRLAVAAATRM
ncbi:MAG TPA: hypothetical protein VF170_02750, partial [Planctomycetaceae bacterium]